MRGIVPRLISAVLLVSLIACTTTVKQRAMSAYQRGDYATARALIEPLAESGDPEALANIGLMYALGQGVPKDLVTAVAYFQRAAEKNSPLANYNLGIAYTTGQGGLERDDVRGAACFKLAAEHRHLESMLTLSSLYAQGRGLEKDPQRALAWAALAAGNTGDVAFRESALDQQRKIAREAKMTPSDVEAAIALGPSLRALIDENVARYWAVASQYDR